MKRSAGILSAALFMMLFGSVQAQNDRAEEIQEHIAKRKAMMEDRKAAMAKKIAEHRQKILDMGKKRLANATSDEEKEKIKAENAKRLQAFDEHVQKMKEEIKRKIEERRQEVLKKFDKDGDGKLSPEERKAAMIARKKEILAKFDKDGDGKLSESEREEARKAQREKFRKEFQRHRGNNKCRRRGQERKGGNYDEFGNGNIPSPPGGE